ncbi:MAG TPA: hypothetical protein IAA26_11225 [Candidatus Blautia faecipullorum]|nr:hypothetical protein [Candidatus Blautia faecipullorum]
MIWNRRETDDLMVDKAAEEAARYVVTFLSAQCEEYNAEEAKCVMEYLRKCKKSISQKIDEAIVSFQKWR